jgi:hypothetical protein
MSEKIRGRKHNPESIEKMRQSKMGHAVTQETRNKISQSKKGKTSWNKGIPISKEQLEKMLEGRRRKRRNT